MTSVSTPVAPVSARRRAAAFFALAAIVVAVTLALGLVPDWPAPWGAVIGIVGCAIAGALLGAGVTLLRMQAVRSND